MTSPFQDLRLPYGFAKRCGAYIEDHEDELLLIHKPGLSLQDIAEIQRFTQTNHILRKQLSDEEFEAAMSSSYERRADNTQQTIEGLLNEDVDLETIADSVSKSTDLLEQADDAPVIRLINAIIVEAVREGASDIHIETYESRLSVRYRVDGVLHEAVQLSPDVSPLLVSRIKVMAKLDIAEKRVPQDGRISLLIGGRDIDIRVSTLPSNNGERVVARLLDKQAGQFDLENLGFDTAQLSSFKTLLAQAHGIVLVTGPTGSGKSTTLYGGLTHINDQTRNILTVEDPIEYNLDGIGQTQVNTKADMTFARGLRAMLRQDPDVVMVGEIRDVETAEIAVQASLTGHLVLSTLHTNSAIGAVTRLRDMGIEPFLLASSIIGIVAQRLVRMLCEDCKIAIEASSSEQDILNRSGQATTIYKPVGCERCRDSGYRGRTAIYEIISIDEDLRQKIHENDSEEELVRQARLSSSSIREDGNAKVLAGLTSIEEIIRVSREES